MPDRVALYIGGVIVAAILIDLVANGGGVSMFLAKKFADLIEWVAVWR